MFIHLVYGLSRVQEPIARSRCLILIHNLTGNTVLLLYTLFQTPQKDVHIVKPTLQPVYTTGRIVYTKSIR